MAKHGHMYITSSLRLDEVTILDERVAELEEQRQELWRKATPEAQNPAATSRTVNRAQVIRAAVRYALEHPTEFAEWLWSDKDAV